ncbi:mechanosensitive ion channel domain-containing protein [Neotamlana laminarinivorans]|uniref:Mechanosensitive ion channel family protein n=1 Tax=Neotamlana laminarinivorans TaxID=2883124 RepID=A0A9X1HX69_9FLAO|nr:mechanosensitive ion channel domain-containing protein [Tamlana laminarinivorans]MCB4797794.1 mechanosensitive ion channel family protein [Tamlana laminarinivorans]
MILNEYKSELIISTIVLASIIIIKLLVTFTVTKIAIKNGINDARIRLIRRYITVTLILIALIIEAFIFGTELEQLALFFSSIFTVLGIALFAVWSILSNITSGVIMFFNFPYKVGDKIKIHDSDFPEKGIIEDIRAFQLILRLENGDLVTYPNNLILQKPVTLVEKDAIVEMTNDIDDEGDAI